MTMAVQVPLRKNIKPNGYMPWSGTDGLYGSSVSSLLGLSVVAVALEASRLSSKQAE